MNLTADRKSTRALGAGSSTVFFLILGIFLLHVWYLRTITEDAFISFRYARNFANGYGLLWNPGWVPVEGYTNFLWVMLLAAMMKLRLPLETASQYAGVIFSLATLLPVYRASEQKWLPVLLLALCGPFAAWATSGLETSLFTFLIFSAFLLHLRERKSASFPFSSFFFFLAALTRPEGLLVVLITLMHLIYSNLKEGKSLLANRLPEMILGFVIPFSIYYLWRYHYYGFLLPNTFYAKVGSTAWQVVRGLKYSGEFYGLLLFPLLAFVRPFVGRTSFPTRYSLWLICIYTAYIIAVGGDYMALFRFFVPLCPFLVLVAAETLQLLKARVQKPEYRRAIVALLCFVCLLPSLPLENLRPYVPRPYYYWAARYDAHPRLLFERWQVNRLVAIGKWLKTKLPAGATLAYGGIGAIGWYADDVNIYDMSGLNDIHIAHKQMRNMGKGIAGHEKEDWLYILARKPDYVLGSRYLEQSNRPQSYAAFYEGKLDAYTPEEQSTILKELTEQYEMQFYPFTDVANHESGYLALLKRATGMMNTH
jgi:hypothetical protein